ncbi:saccharopine dehydrogenase C-terminal domain-containing protein [Promethearchaeum syntrophicum]|uniref:Saccharopine dehydrogenase C-terminal domain-containing protein n=1 Tax=Promethearchaeum syntrophicum TaxID=2594042 RepID=A0A5B9D821_9ARCH|nr:saccharopine dehydrogenase C-terminal domain-containing protein [Candidatus Prometheoarchaeum syntrophicum]QEE14746.1 Saccharopine dehydrogenase [Candidatus Prometheoarchaeum syntrophicum]
MKKVLLFGAGLVAGPTVQYLLEHGFDVTNASRTISKAEKLIGNHPNGHSIQFDISKNPEKLDDLVKKCDIAISLLPYTFHVQIAKSCIKNRKHMATTSYVSDEMKLLDEEAKKAGIILLNEMGVDPGIDHMAAQEIIDKVHEKGGKIESFRSLCGGLPAPEANTNPFGYKLSWSPRGVLLAGRNTAEYLEDGKKVVIPGKDLFDNYFPYIVNGLGDFEAYPNRNSNPYIETYGIQETNFILRGTLRNIGWCSTLKKIADMGLMDLEEREIEEDTNYSNYMKKFLNLPNKPIREAIAEKFNITDKKIIDRLEWLGLLGDEKIPFKKGSPLDALDYLFNKKLQYAPGERDMLILIHEFIASYSDHKEKITATMIDYGIPNGASSMSRTVGLPIAIGVRMILEGAITETGVHIPIKKGIYTPVLKELAEMNIKFVETIEKIE